MICNTGGACVDLKFPLYAIAIIRSFLIITLKDHMEKIVQIRNLNMEV